MEIKIGADELILWLKKNNKANEIENINLGSKIFDLIKGLSGNLIEENAPSLWNEENNKLPKTAGQYIIDTNKLPDLFRELSNW